jgi:hypothetical protein
MTIDEVEVYVTPNGLGRAGIVRRLDGFFCIYVKWKWPDDGFVIHPDGWRDWFDDHTPPSVLYSGVADQEPDQEPEPGIYGTVNDARRELCALRGFADAVLKPVAQIV